jgi:hypothetical protein
MRWGGITVTTNTDKFGWVFASGGTESQAAALPHAKSVVYKSILSASMKTDGRNYGLTGQQAIANGWAMLDTSGNPIYSSSYPDSVLLDLGNPAMQQALADAIIANARQIGIDAVFLDDVVAQADGYASVTPAKYATAKAWEDAMVADVNAVGAKIRAAGFYVVANVYKSGGGLFPAVLGFAAGRDGGAERGRGRIRVVRGAAGLQQVQLRSRRVPHGVERDGRRIRARAGVGRRLGRVGPPAGSLGCRGGSG